jgi:hypothetical protein
MSAIMTSSIRALDVCAKFKGYVLANRAEGEITPRVGAGEGQIAPQPRTLFYR